jgi:hypothetical protein
MMDVAVFRRVSKLALLVGPAVTLTITPLWNYDPINPGKVLVLSLLAFTGFGFLIPSLNKVIRLTGKPIWLVCLLFIFSLLSSFLFSGAPYAQQFWGVFGRNTGLLTYFSLILTLLLFVSLQNASFYRKVLVSLIIAGFLETFYASFQLMKIDPIEWSFYAAFGTLGNVNFLSGFIGIACAATGVFCLSSGLGRKTRIALSLATLWGVFVAYETDSIQGPIAFVCGIGIFLLMRATTSGWRYLLPALTFSVAIFIFLIFALVNRGPLASLVYQVTVIYRADYMQAGLKMIMNQPFFGVGIDSYDDWYRHERGAISAFRTSLNRTANTAHNVAIDIGAGGGVPLLLSYISLIFLVLIAVYRGFKKGYFADVTFLAAVSAWFAYQVQASVSINQIGVGVWGWILSGLIIGYSKVPQSEIQAAKLRMPKKSSKKSKTMSEVSVPASSAVFGGVFACLGFALSFLPVRIDYEARVAFSSGDLNKVMSLARNPITSSFFLTQANQLTLNNKLNDQARAISEILIKRYPRNFYAWTMRLSSPPFSSLEVSEAKLKIAEVDPIAYLCLDLNVPRNIWEFLKELPLDQQQELLRGWGIVNEPTQKGFVGLSQSSLAFIDEKINSNCA